MSRLHEKELRLAIIDYASFFVGRPYRWGGDDPMEGFDCSGLAVEVLKSVGILRRGTDYTSQALYTKFKKYETGEPKKGSLVFYHNGRSNKRIIHVAIALDRVRVIEASGGGSRTKSLQDAVDQNAFIRIRTWKSRKNVAGFLDPVRSII